MPTWSHSYQNTTLTLEDQKVTLQKDTEITEATRGELEAGALDMKILDAFDVSVLAEVYAVLYEAKLPPKEKITVRDPASTAGRPRIPRIFSTGRGSLYTIWLRQKRVSASVSGCDSFDASFEDFLKKGFPEPIRAKLTEGHMIDPGYISYCVKILSELPCSCGTGVERADDHTELQRLSRRDDPRAPIECWAEVGRCRVCGSGWTFEGSGDSHYSYSFSVRPFLY